MQNVLAILLAGGAGERLFPLTKDIAKPAVPFGGAYRIIDFTLSNCINSDVRRILILTQYKSLELIRHIRDGWRILSPELGEYIEVIPPMMRVHKDWYQGTADAVRRNIIHFRKYPHDLILILSGDALYRMDFREIIEQHLATKADVTICAKPFPVSHLEGLGLMRVADDLSIQQFVEKPKDPAVVSSLALSARIESTLKEPSAEKRCLASMGIYVFNRSVLAEALENSMTDFGREVIPALLGHRKMFAHVFEGYWEDIGTVKAFFEANLALAQPLPPFNFFDATTPVYSMYDFLPASKLNKCAIDNVIVADGCILTDSRLKHSVFGIRSFVGEGSDFEDVIMMGADYYETLEQIASNAAKGKPNLGVGKGCFIRRAIIDKNTRIGDGARLTPMGKADGPYAGGAVVIRDGVLVVPKGALIPPGTVV